MLLWQRHYIGCVCCWTYWLQSFSPSFSPISLVVWPFVPSFLRRSRRDRDLLAGSNLLGARSADPPPQRRTGNRSPHTHTTTRDAIKDPFSSSISIKRLVEGRQENKVLSPRCYTLNWRVGIAAGRFGDREAFSLMKTLDVNPRINK